jgi:hypothetical protein
MKKRPFLSLIPALALGLMVAHAAPARAEGAAPPEAQKLLLKMIEAVKAESYEAFLADADANLKKQLSRQQFEGMCGLYSKPLKKGYTLEYFGQLKKRDMAVYVWKVSAAGAQEEVLVRLAVKDGKVGGVMVQ